MSDTEHSCRICRGEATQQQPLIHPCKCRGSIKYIHQECLMEWLEHSGNKAKKCDICNTPYRFVTLYDPNMPEVMPLRDIFEKLLVSTKDAVVKHISVALYLVCVLQLPVYWKLVGRLWTFAVDGKMPSPTISLFHIMAYGAYSKTRSGYLFSAPEATNFDKFVTFMYNTYFSGLLQIVLCVLVLFVVFIEHEWVIREEGYTRSLLKHIGKEPKSKLADLLGQIVENPTAGPGNVRVAENERAGDREIGQNPAIREEMAARALEYLQHDVNGPLPGDNLREALNNGQFDELFRNIRERNVNQGVEQGEQAQALENRVLHNVINGAEDSAEAEAEAGTNELDLIGHQDENIAPADQNGNVPDFNNPHNLNDLNEESDEEPAEELERQRNIREEERAVAEAGDLNANFFEVLGLRLHIITPIQVTFVLDSAVLLLLFFVYFVPQILGCSVVFVMSYTVTQLGKMVLLLKPVTSYLFLRKFEILASKFLALPLWQHSTVKTVGTAINQNLIHPVDTAFSNATSLDHIESPDYLTRFIFLVIGYSVVCFTIYQLMAVLNSGKEPLMGSARKLYKFLFQITATAKVFAIFAIEIVLFPVFCGWLLDFCLTPLLVLNLVHETNAGLAYYIFFTSANDYTQHVVVRFLVYWLLGTAYMFCIALFVSMTRNHILRPGVLYFIKSPEDPNARLIHDAIVKPFLLQMSRIFLSARVYSAFIVFGVGIVTWGLRLLVNPPGVKGALLPIQHFSVSSIQFTFITTAVLFKSEPVITKYCRQFWKHSFAVLCHKLRLSHFILGSPVPQERGYVVYRNLLDSILKVVQPDYTKPVGYNEAVEIFKADPSVKACFVPNGSYVRAPSSDDNSRKFLRQLFVAVTKSDHLISPNEIKNIDDDTDWWDADVVCEDSYTVVYSPPNVRIRCLGLVCMVSVFGALLIVVIALLALFAGRPIIRAWMTGVNLLASTVFKDSPIKLYEGYNWAFIDIDSLCAGLLAELAMLLAVDSSPERVVMMNLAADQRRRVAGSFAVIKTAFANTIFFLSAKFIKWWFLREIHLSYVDQLEYRIFKTSLFSPNGDKTAVKFTKMGIIMHAFMGIWTVLPLIPNLLNGTPPNSFKAWVRKEGLLRLLPSFGLFLLHRLYQAKYGSLDDLHDIYVRLAVLTMVVFVETITNARKTFKRIIEQVKSEKYARGTAVQNIDVPDNE